MYESFFGLVRRPFAAAADADCYYPATAIEAARQTLFRCVERGEGVALLIGPAGSGKSLLLQVLAEQFRERFGIALLSSGRLATQRELLQAILYELDLPYRDFEEGDLRLALIDHLSEGRRPDAAAADEHEGLLLLIDEAHTLSLKLLEEVRLITNLIRGGQPKVRLVLAGSSALEERFASPKLDSFNQRVAARCYLQAFDRKETREYIRAQFEWAGGQTEAHFNDEALDAVYQATHGVPRLINQVCDHALVLASGASASSLDKASIEEAWAELQQLPTPRNREAGEVAAAGGSNGHVIEFGVLDDEPMAIDESNLGLEVAINDAHGDDAHDNELTIDEDAIEFEITEQAPIDGDAVELDLNPDELVLDETPAVPFSARNDTAHDGGFDRHDALRRLAQVEMQIAAIDADDESMPAFAPHVDLSFTTSSDPFGETFTEEELVIDPFAMTGTDALANRPLVYCEEGRKLAAFLRPLPDHPAAKLSLAAPFVGDDLAAAGDSDLQFHPSEAQHAWAGEDEPAPPAVIGWPANHSTGEHHGDDLPDNSPRSMTVDRPIANASSFAHDEREHREPQLIVIEDQPPSMHQVSVVRRNQYRQLFSNLRRG
jgi:type II secretory pathway predicted ATPase ExeA